MKIAELLPAHNDGKATTIYLLYEVKRAEELDEGTDGEIDTEDEDESAKGQQSSSSDEENKEDEDEHQFVDIFTDILGLIVLNKKQKE